MSPSHSCDPHCIDKYCNPGFTLICPSENPSESPSESQSPSESPTDAQDTRRLSLMQMQMEELQRENARLVEEVRKSNTKNLGSTSEGLRRMKEEDVRKLRWPLDSYSLSTDNDDPPSLRGGQSQTQEFDESTTQYPAPLIKGD